MRHNGPHPNECDWARGNVNSTTDVAALDRDRDAGRISPSGGRDGQVHDRQWRI